MSLFHCTRNVPMWQAALGMMGFAQSGCVFYNPATSRPNLESPRHLGVYSMSSIDVTRIVQFSAWFLVACEVVLTFFIVALNHRERANRVIGVLLSLLAVNTLVAAQLFDASAPMLSRLPIMTLAVTSLMIQPVILAATIVLLQPSWVAAGRRIMWWGLWLIAFAPVAITALDLFVDTGFWYTPPDPSAFSAGIVSLEAWIQGSWRTALSIIYNRIGALLPIGVVIYTLIRGTNGQRSSRQVAWLVLVPQVVSVLAWMLLVPQHKIALATLISSTVFVPVYGYVAFRQTVSERREQRGGLRLRLMSLILAVTIPVTVSVVGFVVLHVEELVEQQATQVLGVAGQTLRAGVADWLDANIGALQQLASDLSLVEMEPTAHGPLLDRMAAMHPNMYLISTVDLRGINIARSDGAPPRITVIACGSKRPRRAVR